MAYTPDGQILSETSGGAPLYIGYTGEQCTIGRSYESSSIVLEGA